MKWTIGADIEVMLEKDGKLVSAVPVLPRDDRGADLPNGKIFHDNVLAEFTVTPSGSESEFATNILDNLTAAKEMLEQHQIEFRVQASARYDATELNCRDAQVFGCSPDFDAYAMCVNRVADDADETDLRTAGGHIHFSHEIFEDPFKVIEMIKLMDLYLGVPSILKDNTREAQERRSLYGKAGAHRPKRYPGGEYRSLSNFWIKDEATIKWAYKQTEKCLQSLLDGKTVVELGYDEAEIQRIINEADETAARALVAVTS
jgi:hypothetical protein